LIKSDGLVLRGLGKWCSLVVAAILCLEGAASLGLAQIWVAGGLAISVGLLLVYATLSSKRWASSLNLVVGFLLLIRLVTELLGATPIVVLGADVFLFVLAAFSFILLNQQVRAAQARSA